MANKIPSSGALVPIIGPSGDIQWQSWTYGELVQHLNNDLDLTANDTVGAPFAALQAQGLFLPAFAWWNGCNGTPIANAALLSLDSVLYDTTGGAMRTGTPGKFVAPAAGFYLAKSSQLVVATAAAQVCVAAIAKNGSIYDWGSADHATGAGVNLQSTVVTVVRCVAGDFIEAQYQGTGGLNLACGAQWNNNLFVMRVA